MKLAEYLAEYLERELAEFVETGFDFTGFDFEKVIRQGIKAYEKTQQLEGD